MSRDISPGLLVSSVAAFAFVAFVAGFATASAIPTDPTRNDPIINPDAWQEQAPQPVRWTPTPVEQCNPWDISEVAAEEMLREMVRRGWRPPSQGDVIESLDPLEMSELASLDPNAPVSLRGIWRGRGASTEDEPVDEVTDEIPVLDLTVEDASAPLPVTATSVTPAPATRTN
jgi:hypothetical protein